MVGVVSAMRMFGGGLHGYGFTVFFLPVSQDLGLNRAQTSLAFSLARAEGAIEAPLIGYLVDRLGPRPLMVVAAAFPVTWATSGDFFGRKHFATIPGNMTFIYMWGSALGPVTAGYLYDQTQSYTAVLLGVLAMLSASAFLTALLIRPWSRKTAALGTETVPQVSG